MKSYSVLPYANRAVLRLNVK